jgi:hypothetical protein
MISDTNETGIHVFFEPEPADGVWPTTTAYTKYLGVLQAVNEAVRTGNALKTTGEEMPCNADGWARFIAGKPASFTEELQLVYTRPAMIGFSQWRGIVQVLSHTDRVVLFQYLAGVDPVTDAVGKYLRCGTGMRRLITAVGRSYGGITYTDDYYVLTLDTMNGVSNDYAGINSSRGFWQERAFWEDFWADIVACGMVGRLKMVWADYDTYTKVLTNENTPREYEVLLSNPVVAEPYGVLPGMGYRLQVRKTPIIVVVEDIMQVQASDREYNNQVVISWQDVPLADRYQVYLRTTDTEPSGGELIAEQDPFVMPNVVTEVVAGELFVVELQGGNYHFVTEVEDVYFRGDGLVIHYDNQEVDTVYSASYPEAGTSSVALTYCRNRNDNGNNDNVISPIYKRMTYDEKALAALVTPGRRFYIWVRARVNRDGVTDEWSELSVMVTGLIRNL